MRAANLFCIGCPKSGTTTLFKILCQHSQIHTPKFKEPFFLIILTIKTVSIGMQILTMMI